MPCLVGNVQLPRCSEALHILAAPPLTFRSAYPTHYALVTVRASLREPRTAPSAPFAPSGVSPAWKAGSTSSSPPAFPCCASSFVLRLRGRRLPCDTRSLRSRVTHVRRRPLRLITQSEDANTATPSPCHSAPQLVRDRLFSIAGMRSARLPAIAFGDGGELASHNPAWLRSVPAQLAPLRVTPAAAAGPASRRASPLASSGRPPGLPVLLFPPRGPSSQPLPAAVLCTACSASGTKPRRASSNKQSNP